MMIQTMGFEANNMSDLVNKINKWFGTDPKANGVEFVDIKYSCFNMVDSLPGFGASNNLKYTALVIVKVY